MILEDFLAENPPEKLQPTFDKVAKHLLTQKQPAKIGGKCLYRSADGLMCAVGCLIPEEKYSKEYEGKNVHAVLSAYPELKDIPEINGFSMLLGRLQECHDAHSADTWKYELTIIATNFKLSIRVLQEFK